MSTRSDGIDSRRVGTFLAVAFGVAWTVALAIYLTGGLADSPRVAGPFTLATVLLATGYMFAPAVANVAARVVTDDGWGGWGDLWLGIGDDAAWRYWLAAWVGPVALTLAGAALFFAAFPGYFDASMSAVAGPLREAGVDPAAFPGGVWGFAAVQVVQAALLAPIVNSVFTFGEEFGWRGYLLPILLPLGRRRAAVAVGVVWGVWHWPVIAMGYNYGLDYVAAPWLGMLAMTWFTVVVGVFLSWVTLRSGSVWPAVVGHASVNGIAGVGVLFAAGTPSTLLGPTGVGLVASAPWALLAAWLLVRGEFSPQRAGAGDPNGRRGTDDSL